MKKLCSIFLTAALIATVFTGCGNGDNENEKDTQSKKFDARENITAVTREEGSGTRNVFAELFDFVKDAAEDLVDLTFDGAKVKEHSDDVRAAVADDQYAIGYLSMSSLDSSVKAIKIDGVEASLGNVKSGAYPYSHKLTAVTVEKPDGMTEDFLNFILSAEGQKIVEDNGFISQSNTGAFESKKPSGTLKISCADSANKLLQKLADGYREINGELKIEITRKNAKNAVEDITDGDSLAVLTRSLSKKEKEDEQHRRSETTFAQDGVAVIVHPDNTTGDLSAEQVRKIYKGEIKTWSEITK